MLIYHPAFDAYHCILRMLSILSISNDIEIERARILDFYLTFPSAASKIRMPIDLRLLKAEAKTYSNIYRDPINPKITFREMQHIQEAAIKTLAATNIICSNGIKQGRVIMTESVLNSDLNSSVKSFIHDTSPFINVLVQELSLIPLRGESGLKDRTNLMEYRYDTI
ncbi:hypothetical protein OR606_02215 [Aeromonas hydrophila]|uniref:ABC-three component system middle component 5 n=1 Tax=Aeromonas hydrophila TaxID=644 RepID=UPI001112D63C|nr:ABC-three component system middle component 5 [Aeromonas hydrophila]MCX4039015.1 hypothetical protein [Aeromonas hydrophila]HAU4873700.1 hypothetical protein [Aeromonas hydrophila]HAU4918854.1 hypothetical protein [Aeromonas hydrophila]